jgi:hypothetical protein
MSRIAKTFIKTFLQQRNGRRSPSVLTFGKKVIRLLMKRERCWMLPSLRRKLKKLCLVAILMAL